MTGTALDGITVIDLSQVMAGPYCSMMLADMGAEVIKVEPPSGESTRSWPPYRNGESGAFMSVNRNKRGLSLNLKTDEGKEILYKLVESADVVVENFRPGVVQRLGVDYETLKQVNPRLIYCSISGFGQFGPYSSRGGYDLILQGMTGLMSVTGESDGPPVKAGLPIIDLGTAMFAAFGILNAIISRANSGDGQHIDASLYDTGIALSVWESAQYWYTGDVPQATGSGHRLSAPYQAFEARDGHFTVGADAPHHWKSFCEIIGAQELLSDERFMDNETRIRNLPVLVKMIESRTILEDRSHWIDQFEERGIPAGSIKTYDESLTDPHTIARDMVQTVLHPRAGEVKALGVPVKLSGTPGVVRSAAPTLGEHTTAILASFGYSEEDIRMLRERKAI